tara:strand:+ start:84 stop:1625 length:1542 start_codon:yes stop_codon:yes gene_type:complete
LTKYYYDEDSAKKSISFIEKFCTHTKGDLSGKPLLLEPFQKKIVGDLFGWKNKKTKLRRYKVALIQLPRKNGKTTLAASIILYVLFSGERGNELYAAAGSRGQANIIFSICADMVRQNKHLSERAKVFRSSIVNESKGNFFKSISAESSTAHGFNAGFVLMDELHVQKNPELYQTLLTSQGARTQPLFISITTSGYDKNSIGYEVYNYAKKVQDKVILDEAFYSCIFEASKDDPLDDEKTWIKANPNYGVSLRKDYMERESKRAMEVPSYRNTFLRLHLNIWTDSQTAWLSHEEWMACHQDFDYSTLDNMQCWGGLDLGSTRDLTCLTLLFNVDGKFVFIPYIFIPEENAKKRSARDGVDYVAWLRDGHIFGTPGDVADYSFIRKKINDLSKKYRIQSICYDRWNASQLVIDLQNDGATLDPFGQGFVSMSMPTKTLEAEILSKNIIHNNNPCMNWCLSNVALQEDGAGNIKVAKNKSKEKVDPVVALVMALGSHLTTESGDSIYDTRGVLMV